MFDLLIIDGRHLLYRAANSYTSLSVPSVNGSDVKTGAVYGWIRMALFAYDRFGGVVFVAWDHQTGPVCRKEIYPDYKLRNHDETDRERLRSMAEQEEILKKLLGLAGIQQAHSPKWEADDVIATIVNRFDGARIGILSGDRDMLQLVSEDVSLLRPQPRGDFEVCSPKLIHEQMGIKPKQILDVKALSGDSSDHIPGVSGIGPKRALDLVKEHGSWEAVLKWSSENKPKRKWEIALAESHDKVRTFAKLVRMNSRAPLEWLDRPSDRKGLVKEMTKLKFRSLLSAEKKKKIISMGG